jgi:nicotinate-nucleotide adenylyltransferase
VLLIPAHTAPYKANGAGSQGLRGGAGGWDPGPEHRLRMCELAVAGEDGLAVSAVEIERGGLSYTVDTLTSLHASQNARLTLIVGADTACTLASWREPQRLLELAGLAVAARAGAARQRVLDTLAGIGVAARVSFLEMPTVAVSSSLVRERVAAGEDVEELVGPAVAGYIAEHRLYEGAAASV